MSHPKDNTPIYLTKSAMPAKPSWVPSVVAWQPVYLDDYGNATLVHLEDAREFYIGCTAERVRRIIAGFHAVNTDNMREHFTRCTKKSQSVPLAISARGIIFFSFRARTPRCKNDGAIGYIADKYIHHVECASPRNGKSPGIRIHLTSGCEIDAPMTAALFDNHRQVANYFHYYLRANNII